MSNLPPPVEPGLNLEDLAKLKKTEALKRFKALKTVFRNAAKCKGIMLLIDFPGFADKKKQSIILPFKKLAELKEQWKKLKKDKPLPLGRVAVCQYELDEAGEVRCTQIFGAAAAEKVQAELTELLGLFKLKVALALDLQPDGDEDEAELAKTEADSSAAKTPSNPTDILKTLAAQAQALKAKVQAFGQLEPKSKKGQAPELLKALQTYKAQLQGQKTLPPALQQFGLSLDKLIKQLESSATGSASANQPKLDPAKREAWLDQLEKWIEQITVMPQLRKKLQPQIEKLIAQLQKYEV